MEQKYLYRAMCADLGHILLNWSGAEQSLDMCVTIVFQRLPESHKWEGELPRALNRKTAFLRKAFRNIAALNEFSALGIATIDQMDTLAKDRNDMIHSALASAESINGQWHFLKFDYGSEIHTARPVAFSQADFHEAGKEMMGLAESVQLLAGRLRKRFLPPP